MRSTCRSSSARYCPCRRVSAADCASRRQCGACIHELHVQARRVHAHRVGPWPGRIREAIPALLVTFDPSHGRAVGGQWAEFRTVTCAEAAPSSLPPKSDRLDRAGTWADAPGGAMAQQDEVKLRRLLDERLALVNNDPTYEGAESSTRDQLLLAAVGLLIPALLLIGGWVFYGG